MALESASLFSGLVVMTELRMKAYRWYITGERRGSDISAVRASSFVAPPKLDYE